MNLGTITMGLVSILVAVLVIGLVAIPVIEDSQEGISYSGTNEGTTKYVAMGQDFDGSAPNFTVTRNGDTVTTTINGNTETLTLSGSVSWPVVTDSFMVRMNSNGTTVWDSDDSKLFSSTQPGTNIWTMTCVDGAVTVTNAPGTLNESLSCDFAVVRSESGTWGRFEAPKVTLGTTILTGALPVSNSTYGPIRLSTVVNGSDLTTVFPAVVASGTTLVSVTCTETMDYSIVGGEQGVGYYAGSNWTMTDGSTTESGSKAWFWAPYAYESSSSSEGGTNSILLGIIPVLLLVVAMMIAARMIKEYVS